MIGEQLQTLTITNFRSIKGTIFIPLNAPIILLHGANGAGKTSVLFALELALTGDIAAMRRDDRNFLRHLVHDGASSATIGFSGPGLTDGDGGPGFARIADGRLEHKKLLEPAQAQFFAERCFLAQSLLVRLLDIYQRADADKDSLLTRFVKDLLRLDELDALVEGLHDSHHLTRAKNLAPPLRMADDRRRELREKRDAASRRNGEQTAALSVKRQALNDRIAALLSEARMLTDLNALRVRLAEPLEDRQLVAVLQHKRELSSLAREWHTFPSDASADERRALEAEELLASDAAQEWREHSGRELESIIETLREIFPELPSWASTDPEFAHSAAAERVKSEIDRLAATLAVEDANANREGELDQEIGRFDARLKIIDDQVLGLSDTASGLSRALAEIVPHIHSDDCPVCGQDFSKTGKGSLMQHVQAKIASLTEQAGRLAALSTERSQTQTLRSGRAREKAQVAASRLSSADRLALQARMASLAAPAQSLAVIAKQVAVGADILRRQTRAQRRLAELRDRDRRAGEVRSTLSALCATLEQPGLGRSESIEAAFFRIEGHLADKENHWTRERDLRLGALSACEDLIKAENDAVESRRQADEAGKAFITIEQAYQVAERRRQQARRVADVARDVRSSIVRRVFNESLNTLWRDLFIRLAPTEPYVPAFSLPQTAEGVVAQLETRHRSGARGGTPGSMLSAGNLNTAALTLFLSLHLSVEPKFPWLVLDDPVQSMDEVHISQFAALLRKISKDHGRKVLIATHDRQLFNYLALELSPAFPNDQLITVELSRSATDATMAPPGSGPTSATTS